MRQFASFLPGTGMGGAGEHWNGMTPRFLPDCFEIAHAHRGALRRRAAAGESFDSGLGHHIRGAGAFLHARRAAAGHFGEGGTGSVRRAAFGGVSRRRRRRWRTSRRCFGDAARSLGYHPFPVAFGQSESDLSESRRHRAAGLRVLRLLRALRMHGGREGAADEHADAGDRAAEKRDRADGRECAARAL